MSDTPEETHRPSLLARLTGAVRAYPSWVIARANRVILITLGISLVGAFFSATLPLHTDFSFLLPEEQPSVVDLRKLTARKPTSAVIEIGVGSSSPDATRRFAADLASALRKELPPSLMSQLDDDDGDMRRFIWQHRHLYASLPDLEHARDALKQRIADEEAKQNPFLVDLSDAPAEPAGSSLDDLKKRLDEAHAIADRAPGYVGEGGKLRMLVLRAPYGDGEPEKAKATLDAVDKIVNRLDPASYAPDLEVGFAGDPVTGALEHSLVLRDVGVSMVLCLLLVMLAMLLVFRAPRAVFALCITLGVGCAITFGFTRLWIGHLNSSTAFLGSVVAGNGINFGIILLGRYLEERRRGASHAKALPHALQRTALPTLVAAAAAGTSYLSLIITSFRGFSEFGIIAGSGMLFCWAMNYLLLPALLTWLDRRKSLVEVAAIPLDSRRDPAIMRARWMPPLALAIVTASVVLSTVGAIRLARDPFEDNLRNLRSRSLAESAPGRWSRRLDAAFGRDQSGGYYLGVDQPEEIPIVVAALAKLEANVPPAERVFGRVDALPIALPGDRKTQEKKLVVLDEIEALRDKALPHVPAGSPEAALLEDFPPHGSLKPLSVEDLPARVRHAFTERDGRVGLLIAVHPGPAYPDWSQKGIAKAVALLRSIDLPPTVRAHLALSGPEVILVDMVEAVRRDGPRASLWSLTLVLLLLVAAFRFGRDLLITGFALAVGIFGMLALMALLGVRLNFLNYIAIPITIGIGVDYPFNVTARLRQEQAAGKAIWRGLLNTGGAVVLCSLTTMIGYAVLLLSDTGAIRSFGMAAVLGEMTSIFAAIVIVPAFVVMFLVGLRWWKKRGSELPPGVTHDRRRPRRDAS